MRVHKLQNVQNALNFLQKERRIKLVNIRNDEVVDGNPKLILGLIWTLILHFQVSSLVTACLEGSDYYTCIYMYMYLPLLSLFEHIRMYCILVRLVLMCVFSYDHNLPVTSCLKNRHVE